MTLPEQKALLAQFAKAAGAGDLPNIHDLKAACERAIGHSTSNSTIYDLLARHGWRKLMPRPFRPNRDIVAQSAFKKTAFQMLWSRPDGLPPDVVAVCASCSPTKRALAV
jgi:Winged helix-turn helix